MNRASVARDVLERVVVVVQDDHVAGVAVPAAGAGPLGARLDGRLGAHGARIPRGGHRRGDPITGASRRRPRRRESSRNTRRPFGPPRARPSASPARTDGRARGEHAAPGPGRAPTRPSGRRRPGRAARAAVRTPGPPAGRGRRSRRGRSCGRRPCRSELPSTVSMPPSGRTPVTTPMWSSTPSPPRSKTTRSPTWGGAGAGRDVAVGALGPLLDRRHVADARCRPGRPAPRPVRPPRR